MEQNQNTQVQLVSIHRSLTRPQLIAGCDRELFVIICLFAVLLAIPGGVMSGSLFNFILGLGILSLGIPLLSWMSKKDSSMRAVFIRSLRYMDKYRAGSPAVAASRYRHNLPWA